jgi:hypothetical protein
MPRRSTIQALFLLATLIAAVPSFAAHSRADRAGDPWNERDSHSLSSLLVLTQRLIAAQNNRLLSADAAPPALLAANPPAQNVFVVNDARRTALAAHGMRYTSIATTFSDVAVAADGVIATVGLTEDTTLTLAYTNGDTAALPDYQYQQAHTLTFHYADGRWTLTAQATPEEFELAVPTGGPVDMTAFAVDADDERKESAFAPRLEALATGTKTLNRSNIVGYAWAFVGTYLHTSRTEGYNNAQYRPYAGNDCTNFVSQALKYGGWTDVTGWYQSDTAWWYNPSPFLSPGASYTWGGAQNFSNFVSQSGRGYLTTSVQNLDRGDVLQADWNNDGIADHTMIVTKRDAQGNIFLTYHSSNERDRPFWDLDAAMKKSSPKLQYRRWRLRDQFN